MPRRCTICDHPKCAEIDRALVGNGTSYRRIAAQFGVAETSLRRHKAEHLPVLLVKAKEAEEVMNADTLLEQVRQLKKRAMALLDGAEKAQDFRTALGAIREARGTLELLAKLVGELQSGTVVNVGAPLPHAITVREVEAYKLSPEDRAALARIGVRVLDKVYGEEQAKRSAQIIEEILEERGVIGGGNDTKQMAHERTN